MAAIVAAETAPTAPIYTGLPKITVTAESNSLLKAVDSPLQRSQQQVMAVEWSGYLVER